MKTTSRITAVACGVVLMMTMLVLPGGAAAVGNTVTIKKSVVGPVPGGTVFTVELTCMGLHVSGVDAQGVEPIVVTFDEHGNPTSPNQFPIPSGLTCTANETGTGGASSVTYACEMTTTHPTLATCESPTTPTVSFNDVVDGQGVITVTNTFPTPTTTPEPPPEVAPEVVVAPAFTG